MVGNQHIIFEILVNINWNVIFLLESDLSGFSFDLDIFTSFMSKQLITIIDIESADCDITVNHDVTFVIIDEPEGSMKGKHKLVGKCFSVILKSKATTKLKQNEKKIIVVTW